MSTNLYCHKCNRAYVWQSEAFVGPYCDCAPVEVTTSNNTEPTHAEELTALCARVAQLTAALQFIAAHGGKEHETELGWIDANGSFCAEQARAALDAAKGQK